MKKLLPTTSYSLKDFRLLPGYSPENNGIGDVSLRSPLCLQGEGHIFLDLPFLSAAMGAVTGIRMATALAELGGAGVLPLSLSIEEQCEKVKMVKRRQGALRSVVFKKDPDKHIQYPNATVDPQKRLRVGAAVSTHPEDQDRVRELIKVETDFIVIDSSNGSTSYQKVAIEWIKKEFDIPVIGGNVVTAKAFDMLGRAGADAVKIGMGTGSGCITQEVKATGRGQATAIMEVAKARENLSKSRRYIPLIADGGINSPADMAIALAMGADTVMMGNYFARFTESPGGMHRINGKTVKEYWMEGSIRGHNHRRYEQADNTFIEEGIEGYVPYAGSLYEYGPVSKKRLEAALYATGALTMDQFHKLAVLEQQSPLARIDGKVHHMIRPDRCPESSEKLI